MKISGLLATKGAAVVTIAAERSLTDAARKMMDYEIGALIVLDDSGSIAGILNERDVVRATSIEWKAAETRVRDLMTNEVITCEPTDDLMSVAHTMTEHKTRHMPVLRNKKLVGIVSLGDIVKAQRDLFMGEMETLETELLADDNNEG